MKKDLDREDPEIQADDVPDDWIIDGFLGLAEEIEDLKKNE